MATSFIGVNEGSAKNVATNSITEDTITKQIQRAVLNKSDGTEIGTTSNPVIVSGAVASGSADSGNPVKIGLVYNSAAPVLSTGQRVDLQADINGNVKDTLATLIAGEDLTNNVMKSEAQYSYKHLTADGQVKATAGYVHTVTFSATGTVTSGVITLYDSASETGTVVWSGVIQTGINPTTIFIDSVFGTGIYVGYDGTIANVGTTVSYR